MITESMGSSLPGLQVERVDVYGERKEGDSSAGRFAVELGGARVGQGDYVFLSPWVTHRHPALWSNPEGFDPDRFLPERLHALEERVVLDGAVEQGVLRVQVQVGEGDVAHATPTRWSREVSR